MSKRARVRLPESNQLEERRERERERAEHLARGLYYVTQGRRRPKGWALAHNHVLHTKTMRNGWNGFRYFWVADRSGWSRCHCGWRPDRGVHYSKRPNTKTMKWGELSALIAADDD